jgi:MFS family permease
VRALRELKVLLRLRDFRRLFAIRLTSQFGDGLIQFGLAALFFFSPEKASTAHGVAAAFAVLLAPFTIVGPWAGVFLDRWRRRQVLLVGNLLRVVFTLLLVWAMAATGEGVLVYVLALTILSINRFLLAALSAALPRVVDGELLVTANSVAPTLGAGAAFLGAAAGVLLHRVLPTGGPNGTLVAAAVVFLAASLLPLRLAADRLGPDHRPTGGEIVDQLRHLAHGLADGARHVMARRTPANALAVMAIHRFIYGAMFIAAILVSRNVLAAPSDTNAGFANFAVILGASAVGFGLAAVVTPVVHEWISPHRWIALCLVLGAASQLLLTITLTRTTMLIGSVLLGLAVQGGKIAVDTIVQRDTDDDYRGRAFSLYDMLYNSAFVAAAALAALVLPDTGYSRIAFGSLAIAYLVAAAWFTRTRVRPILDGTAADAANTANTAADNTAADNTTAATAPDGELTAEA